MQNEVIASEYYRKIYIHFIWLISYDTNSRNNVYCKVILFLIAYDWYSPIIVTKPNVFYIWFLRISSINFIVGFLFWVYSL